MSDSPVYQVLAFYIFTPIENPESEVKLQKEFLSKLNATSRIYISEEGINAQMSLIESDAEIYINWMKSRPPFDQIHFKVHHHHEHAFPKLIVKYRKQLVALDKTVDMAKIGEHVSPEKWREMLEKQDNKILIDVRNDYEWELGHFEGADLPACGTFREFHDYTDELKERVDPKTTPVMMYCTGGIRCELYSALLKEQGFEKVYQLNGGVINYGLEEGSKHWLGKLFVFDDRLSVPISSEETPVIGKCHHCQNPTESYYNCANMDCNTLFLCCPECLTKHQGTCQSSCECAPRRRPYQEQNAHKPFRKWHNYFKEKNSP